MAALAEVAWSPLAAKDEPNFRQRLTTVLQHYDAAGLNRGPVFAPPARQTKDGSAIEPSPGTQTN